MDYEKLNGIPVSTYSGPDLYVGLAEENRKLIYVRSDDRIATLRLHLTIINARNLIDALIKQIEEARR